MSAADLASPRPLAGLLTAALIVGLIAGLLATALQSTLVWPLIAQAEVFEEAAETPHATTDQHGYGAAPSEAASPLMRAGLSVLTNIAVGVGYALLMAAAMVLTWRKLTWQIGLVWGLAGYLTFVLMPALGLQPVPPGVETGALTGRQLWWIATAFCTAGGLGLMLLSRGKNRLGLIIAGIVLLALPHIVGAPVGPPEGAAPVELRRQFAWTVLITTLPPWLATGVLLGGLLQRYRRQDRKS